MKALEIYYNDFRRFLRDTIKENKRNGDDTEISDVFDTFTQMYVYVTHTHDLEWVNKWYKRYNTQINDNLYEDLLWHFGKSKIRELKKEYEHMFEEIEEMDQEDLEWYGYATVEDQWIAENYNMILTLLSREWLVEKLEKKDIFKGLAKRYNATLVEVIPVNNQ